MMLDIPENKRSKINNSLICERIHFDNCGRCSFGEFSNSIMKKYLSEQTDYVKGFLFKNSEEQYVGYIWVMLKGGEEVQYKIKNIEAFIFDVCVEKKYRKQGVASYMMSYVENFLLSKGIKRCHLAVRKDNTPAINLYKKLGFEIIGCRSFARICKINIPYYTL